MKNQKKIHKITTKLYNVYKLIYKTESCGCKVGQKKIVVLPEWRKW